MQKEVESYGKVITYGGLAESELQVANLDLNDKNFDPADPTKRPTAWYAMRAGRVLAREYASKMDPTLADQTRGIRELMEEDSMLSEIQNYIPFGGYRGGPFVFGKPGQGLKSADLPITEHTFDLKDENKRPRGWVELRTKRIYAKERAARVDTDSDTLMNLRPNRERQVNTFSVPFLLYSHIKSLYSLQMVTGRRPDVIRSTKLWNSVY
jgi:hypothetical protein